MKKIIGMLAMALCLVGCGKGPDNVAVRFFEAMRDGKYEAAMEMAAKDTKPLIGLMQGMMTEDKRIEEFAGEYKAVETKIDGDTAKVKIEHSKDGKSKTENVDLVKEDGDWKVKINKDNKKN
jgi:hypothetical protein